MSSPGRRNSQMKKDVELAVELAVDQHETKDDNENVTTSSSSPPEEEKSTMGEHVKSIIYGGLDGIITTFAIVAGVQGANLKPQVVLVLGFANLIADAISMGFGDYLSDKAELDYSKHQLEIQQKKFNNSKQKEIDGMIKIHEEKYKISNEKARSILTGMSQHRNLFINHLMMEKLGIEPPDDDANPAKNGLVTFISFIVFGLVPLLSYVFLTPFHTSNTISFWLSVALTVLCLFSLGVFKARLTRSNMIKDGLFIALNGSAAAGASFLIGFVLGEATGIRHDGN